ncbi:8341_t:CDS:2 [Scutellospora calospora]|uniref:8341_t:CDS:1 n=1 Tax=Scutellospora calospora TaxID=85575 RepID=A0ACA9LJK6_9GLOM|nr:8341_t:CDS:2 [Scutellospora calospora]
MVRKTRSDKKDTICKHCSHECSISQKLPQRKPYMVIPILVLELEPEKEALVLGNEPLEVNDLDSCKTLFYDLEQYNSNAVCPLTLKELEEYEKKEIKNNKSSYSEASHQSKNLINKEFEYLGEIKEYEKSEKDLEFREQEELETTVKRRAIAIHHAKVLKSYPDNGSDIRKMLESRRKQFREILEKKFNKHRQFKFTLCSFTKFLIDDKPRNEKQGKKNLRTDWLRNKQIIVYNRAKIDNYLSDTFEQILY